jgi:hypothetical protein
MSRKLLFSVLLLAASVPLAAQERGDQAASSAPDLASLIAPVKTTPITENVAPMVPAMELRSAYSDVSYQFAGGEGSSKPPSDFRSICDCGCTIECLDRWCICEDVCCTTNEWCNHGCDCAQGNCYLTPNGWVTNDGQCDVWGYDEDYYSTAFRMGAWGLDTQGSLNKIGEYQQLRSSEFWDLDGIYSNGDRTLDFWLSGLDNEANNAHVYYYGGPGLSARLRYDRFFRRVDHDALQGFPRPTFPAVPGPAQNVIVEDLNVGEDYAIRVQQLDARFQGNLSDNVKWRLNLWGLRKFGERQQNATAHCFNVNAPAPAGATGNVCHVLSQRQAIDWTTMEIQPVVEAQFDAVTVEYSRTMRGFGQSDDSIFRQYTRFNFNFPAGSGFLGPDYQYGIVPESFTQIDRVKVQATVSETQHLYANLYLGDTRNDFRDTHRQFGGYDVRFIDRSFERLTSTAYVSMYEENNQLPPFFFTDAPFSHPVPVTNPNPPPATTSYDQASIRHPVDYNRIRVGLKGNWRPTVDPTTGTTWVGGYEYYELNRDYAEYTVLADSPFEFTFVQPDTKSHLVHLGPEMRWSNTQSTYVRYKGRFIEDPLIGVREFNGRFNTNQPEQDHRIELGGTWNPATNFTATAEVAVVNSWHFSEFANFSQDSYPWFFNLWYAPTDRLSLTGGYAYFSNWIDQDITLGFTTPGVPVPPLRTETTEWNYRGENHLVSLNAVYLWTETVNLTAGYEWNRGSNTFRVPPSPAGANWFLLPAIGDVVTETQRVTLGADWQPYDSLTLFARYIFYDWNDISARDPATPPGWLRNDDSGLAHMGLAGATLIW